MTSKLLTYAPDVLAALSAADRDLLGRWHHRCVFDEDRFHWDLDQGGFACMIVDWGADRRGYTRPKFTRVGMKVEWTVESLLAAQETLVDRGLLPDTWIGDPRRRWHINGWIDALWRDVAAVNPPHHSALLSVAALGWREALRAEELALEAVHWLRSVGGPAVERVAWTTMLRRERKDMNEPLCWWARDGGARISMADVLSTDGLWYPADGLPVVVPAARALWDSGLSLTRVTHNAAYLCVPPLNIVPTAASRRP